ncbi:MAG: hypothetical protein ACRBFS_15500 [Aureispira sp.]
MSNHNNETFVFDGKTKLFTIVLMAIGAVCLGWSYFAADPAMSHMRFWTNYLQNSVFFTGIAFAAVLFIATHALAWGGWVAMFKRIPEAMMSFLYIGAGLFLLLGIGIYIGADGTDLLYLWNDQDYLTVGGEHFDKLAFHKSAFVNPIAYLLTVLVIGSWSIFAYLFRKVSLEEDSTPYQVTAENPTPRNVKRTRIYAAAFLPIAGFSSAYAIWQWVMSVDTHWYSTLFAWYATVSMWVSMLAMCFMIIIFLKSRGLLKGFNDEHMHDLGKYIFGFSVFWTYLWFSQFMLIWYANNGEETQYFFIRFEQFKVVFFANLLINFVLPFLILMMNTAKRTLGTLGFVAGLVFFGHWLDFYQMIKPGVWYNYEHKSHLTHSGHGHGDDAHQHSENTYHLNSETPKAVLTTYQGDQHEGDDHSDEHGPDDADHSDHGHDHTGDATTDHDTPTNDHGATADHSGDDHGHTSNDHGHAESGHDDHGHEEGEHAPAFVMGVHFPGFLEIGTFLGFLGLFLFVTFSVLGRASLYPPNDPYILESEFYDTGIGPERDPH